MSCLQLFTAMLYMYLGYICVIHVLIHVLYMYLGYICAIHVLIHVLYHML